MNVSPRSTPLGAVLWIPEDVDVAVLNIVDGRLSAQELEDMQAAIANRLGIPAIIASGMDISVRRYV